MSIALLGSPTAAHRKALEPLTIVGPERAELRVVIAPRPPTRAPKAPWVWVAPREVDPQLAATAVLAGAYDAIAADSQLAETVKRRLAELRVQVAPGTPPEGYVARSQAARRVLADLDRAARTSFAVLLTGETGTGKDLA